MKKLLLVFVLMFSMNVYSFYEEDAEVFLDLSQQEFFYNSGMEIVCTYKSDIALVIRTFNERKYNTWQNLINEQRCFMPPRYTFKIFPYMNRPIGNVGNTNYHAIYMDAMGSKVHMYCVNGFCDNDIYARKAIRGR
jgi:hypothetical protein